jgi:hypothetical protein
MKQGKFWEMHHILFEHQEALEARDIEKYAKEIGVDFPKWKTDWESEATADRVSRDRKQGDAASVTGTPAIYINGREYELSKFDMGDDLEDWIKLEIELATGSPTTPAAAPPAPRDTAAGAKIAAPGRADAGGSSGRSASKP